MLKLPAYLLLHATLMLTALTMRNSKCEEGVESNIEVLVNNLIIGIQYYVNIMYYKIK